MSLIDSRENIHKMDVNSSAVLRDNFETSENYSTPLPLQMNDTHLPSNITQVTLPAAFLITAYTVRVIWSILAIAGNSLTIIAVTKFSSLHSSTNYLLVSLAVGDLITGLQTPVMITHNVLSDHPSFVPMCLIEKTFSAISIRANYFNILWISIDRFLYIAYPLRYPLWQTNTKTFILIALTWGYLTIDTPLVMYFGNILKPGGLCKVAVIINGAIYNYYWNLQMVVCLVVTIICYILIAKIAHKHSIAIGAQHQPFETLEASIHHRQKKIAKMMFTVLATYLLSYIPQILVAAILQNNRTFTTVIIERVTTLIYYTNSFLNPIIYAWKSKEFKTAFKKLLHLKNDVNTAPWQDQP